MMRPAAGVRRLPDLLEDLELERGREAGAALDVTCTYCTALAVQSCAACDSPLCEDDDVDRLCPDCRGFTP